MVGCKNITIGSETTPTPTGFRILASKTSGTEAYNSIISISKPDSAGKKVSLIYTSGALDFTTCLQSDILLDSQGKAQVEVLISETCTLWAVYGIGCCLVYTSLNCDSSNKLRMNVGWDVKTIALYAGAALAGVIVLQSVLRRN